MDAHHPRHRQRPEAQAPVTPMKNGLVGRSAEAILARLPVAHQKSPRTDSTVIVEALDYRHAYFPARVIHGRGEKREEIVHVDNIRREFIYRCFKPHSLKFERCLPIEFQHSAGQRQD